MWTAFNHDELAVVDQIGQSLARLGERQDPVSVSLDHEERDVDLGQVATKSVFQDGMHATRAAIADAASAM